MVALISAGQYQARHATTLTIHETAVLEDLIADASALVVDIADNDAVTATWDVNTTPATVVPVVVAMVRRGLDNPHGFTSESQHGYSYRGASSAGVFATRDEARIVRDAASTSSIGAVTLTGLWS